MATTAVVGTHPTGMNLAKSLHIRVDIDNGSNIYTRNERHFFYKQLDAFHIHKSVSNLQGLFVPFACVGSSDPVRVLHLLHNEYTGCS